MMSVATMTAMPPAQAGGNTAAGYLALLQEEDVTLRAAALSKLLERVGSYWHEVAEALPELEAAAEDAELPAAVRQTAAAVASRVFFHLEEPVQALRLALEAGEQHFDPMDTASPYVERLVAAALDAYITLRAKELDEGIMAVDDSVAATAKKIDDAEGDAVAVGQLPADQLKNMVHRLLDSSCAAGKFDHALGIALEARETETVRKVLQASGPDPALLQYAYTQCNTAVTNKAFRCLALQVIADGWKQLTAAAEGSASQQKEVAFGAAANIMCVYQLLGQAKEVSQVLVGLLRGSEEEALLGLQLCFDLMDSGDQAFIKSVAADLKASAPPAPTAPAAEGENVGDDENVNDDSSSKDKVLAYRFSQAERVLVGGFVAELALSFLHKQSHADRYIMDHLKKSLEERSSGSRSSVLHTAAVVTHSYLYAGTTNDSFLRDYLDWMKKASNWAKFSATASLGVVHASHITEAMHLLEPYLPSNPTEDGAGVVSPNGGYAEGGSLYALGLIHGSQAGSSAEKRQETTDFLRTHLRASHANEVICHGAALGVGLTAMGTANLNIVTELKEVLDTDSAVAGEAAGIAIGLVLVGTGAGNIHNSLHGNQVEDIQEVVAELRNYARETAHEKIIRGIAVGIALMNFGQEEAADAVIEDLRSDRDPVMRYGAQYCLALAYCGTGSNKVVRLLLHTAVSDVSDDVRMAAVIGLAFVLFKTPERVPQLVQLLLESFNPHVRYASCVAVGIAMAGTGDADSVAMLEPMLEDMTDYVRQGALLGTAMIYMQQSDTCNGRKIRAFRERIATICTEKHQSTMTKMGAIMATGIMDAGGRNCSLRLGSLRNGFTKMSSAVGLALWLQHWHWYPMMHMLSLALTPTFTIGLNKDYKYPKKHTIICDAKPSQFAYPRKLEGKKEEKKKRVETVTLSTTAKEKARLARKRAKLGQAEPMDVDKEPPKDKEDKKDNKEEKKEGDAMDIDDDNNKEEGGVVEEGASKKPKKKPREPEPSSFRIANPARITAAQAAVCRFDKTERYRPVRGLTAERPFGVILLTDSRANQGEEEELGKISLEPVGELPPPEPFAWTPPSEPAAAAAGDVSDDAGATTSKSSNDADTAESED